MSIASTETEKILARKDGKNGVTFDNGVTNSVTVWRTVHKQTNSANYWIK